MAAHRGNRLAEAVDIYREVLRRLPGNPLVLTGLGAALLGLGKSSEAVTPLETAFEARPDHPDTCFILAEAYRDVGRIEDAFEVAKTGLEGNPDYLQGRMAMADALLDMGRHDEARAAFEDIERRDPDDWTAAAKLGAFHYQAGEFEAAEVKLSAAVRHLPDDVEAHWHLGVLYLSQRRWAEGWPLYRWRWPMAKRADQETMVDLPVWGGEPLTGKRLVVWSEQGLGDELMFATCLKGLLDVARPAQCVWSCDRRLAGLFERNFPGVVVLPLDKSAAAESTFRVPESDVQISAGDLPGILRARTEDFPTETPRLYADPVQVSQWRARLDDLGPGLKVGIAWRGGMLERFKRSKSSRLIDWADILTVPGVQFVNLQHGDCVEELVAARAAHGAAIHHFDDLNPVDAPGSQMALIGGLDLVVQTSNASAHMAGILGVPVWNMVPYVPDWRWSLEGERCLWYDTMRLLRQPALGDWASVFAQAGAELRDLVAQKG